MIGFVVGISVVVAAGLIVFVARSTAKAARCGKPKYFNIGYRPAYGIEFCRAHLVGKVYRLDNRALYLIEIHPKDAAKVRAWTISETELRGVYLLEKGKFYKLAFKEELYERTKATP